MNKGKISVIAPVYNVAAYLEECMDALLSQTYANIEILLIDDGSTDGSAQICDAFAQKDARVRVIHQRNGGAANARNAGLDLADGEYIAFVDSDDIPHPDYLEHLFQLVQSSGAEIGVCAYRKRYVSRCEVRENLHTGVISAQDYLQDFISDWACGLIWNKLFRADVLQQVRFEEGHVIDDEFFTYKAVLNAKRIALSNVVLYDYRQRSTGVMSQGRKKRMLQDRMAYYPERFELVTKAYPGLYSQYLSNLADTLIAFRRQAAHYPDAFLAAKKLQNQYCARVIAGKIGLKEKYAYLRSMFEGRRQEEAAVTEEFEDYFA